MNLSKLLMLILCVFISDTAWADACDMVKGMTLSNASVTGSQQVSAGDYQASNGGSILMLPAHCRVSLVLTPSPDSHIEMQIWLPNEHWNGKFLAVGNGGWAGSISLEAMARGLQTGYAAASNDTGHKGGSASFAMGQPEKLEDFGHRAMHEMVLASRVLIEKFYGRGPQLSYFEGCSTGGRQGLMAAQRYPQDFDAIIAGAPVNNMFSLTAAQMHRITAVLQDSSLYLPPDKIELLSQAVLQACEATDGVEDGFLNNPLACNFDPAILRCQGGESPECLTERQVESVRRAYRPVLTRTGERVYPGHARGFEKGWRMPAPGSTPSTLQSDTFTYIVHEDPAWDWQAFDLEQDYQGALQHAGPVHAVDADLTAFKARGGKLLLYHGWNDPGPSPLNTINYYRQILETMGEDQDDWLRLFMLPGMGHCRGGIGPDQANFLSILESWRETDFAPARITAARLKEGQVDMTRPLCPYPEAASWTGRGSTLDAANYVCKEPAL